MIKLLCFRVARNTRLRDILRDLFRIDDDTLINYNSIVIETNVKWLENNTELQTRFYNWCDEINDSSSQ